jgi:hypothetical protein
MKLLKTFKFDIKETTIRLERTPAPACKRAQSASKGFVKFLRKHNIEFIEGLLACCRTLAREPRALQSFACLYF